MKLQKHIILFTLSIHQYKQIFSTEIKFPHYHQILILTNQFNEYISSRKTVPKYFQNIYFFIFLLISFTFIKIIFINHQQAKNSLKLIYFNLAPKNLLNYKFRKKKLRSLLRISFNHIDKNNMIVDYLLSQIFTRNILCLLFYYLADIQFTYFIMGQSNFQQVTHESKMIINMIIIYYLS